MLTIAFQGGVRVAIHKTNELPLMAEHGFNLKPKSQTTLAVREEKVERLKPPYTSMCSDSWKNTNYTHIVPHLLNKPGFLPGWGYSLVVCSMFFL